MRRFRRPAVTVSKRRVILFRLFWCFCAAFAVFSVLDNRLRPVITTMAQYQCRVVSVLAMNEAVMEELNEVQDIEQALVEVDKAPDGTVSAIEINSVEVNRLKTRLTDAVANRLLSVPKQDVRIPLGTLLGWQIMAGRGPDIPLQVVPASFVQSTDRGHTGDGGHQPDTAPASHPFHSGNECHPARVFHKRNGGKLKCASPRR